jgi:RHS repeat-associated protein
VRSGNKETYNREYSWNPNHQLTQTLNKITNGRVGYTYDAFGSLASAYYEDGTYDYKLPDEVGNLYKTESKKDRVYGRGGKLLQDPDWYYGYDSEGNLQIKSKHSLSDNKDNKEATQREWHAGDWWYEWNANGMLRSVKRPDSLVVAFEYDALGRRTAKIFKDTITRFVWDENVLLHQWEYQVEDRPKQIVNDIGEILLDKEEPVENLVTWVYEEGSFVPSAKIINEEKFSIISDYIGRPVQAFSETGKLIWETDYDIYGGLRNVKGDKCFVPFRQLGQYEDEESELYYNRYRYYSAQTGSYISQDPIGLIGGSAFYAYVHDSNGWVDIFGLAKCKMTAKDKRANLKKYSSVGIKKPHHHHVVREKAPKSWSAKDQKYVTDSQDVLKKAGIDINKDPRNFTIAENGGGAHTKEAAKYVHDKVTTSTNLDQTLSDLAKDMNKGIFF